MTTEAFRYAAFISYSSKDSAFAQRLHRALESYGIPSSLGALNPAGSRKRNRIYPVFRDREELSAGQLGEQIEANLRASGALIVVCSPNGAASPWVQKEIEFFSQLKRQDRILAIISDSAPLTDEAGADATLTCFPPVFRGDALSGDKLEPLAADARRGKDGFRNAWLKLVAGLVGVSPGQLIDRDRARGRHRIVRNVVIGALVALGAIGLAATETRWRPTLYAFMNSEEYYDAIFTEPLRVGEVRDYAQGAVGSDVLYNGLRVGAASRARLDVEDPRRVIVRIGVHRGTPVRRDSRVELTRLDGRVVFVIDPGSPASPLIEGGGARGEAPMLQGSVNASARN